ncbi:MAG: nucleotidyltransferase domain-containing protein, partial [Candidatus Altiarchaeales archaeon]|nr:nucleotidyltransferase domain-containing protein [Candidatus Altiarchaeales archaeon]
MKNVIDDNRLMDLKKKVAPILKRNKVVRAGVFGSFATGEAKRDSDIDILIEVKAKKFSLLDLVGLELELKEKLKRKVDLVEYSTIHPLLKERILGEEVPIL